MPALEIWAGPTLTAKMTGPRHEEYSGTDIDPLKPLVLLIGFLPEGALSGLRTTGGQFKVKLLESRPSNWAEIAKLFEQYDIQSVVVSLTGTAYAHLANHEYRDVAEDLFTRIAAVPHAAFAFEALAFPSAEPDADEPIDFSGTDPEILRTGNEFLARLNIRVTPYRRNAELAVLASAFISDTEEGLLFKCYIPKGRIWAGEIDRMLALFRDYLSRTRGTQIRLSEHRTNHGIIYKLLGHDSLAAAAEDVGQQLSVEFAEFADILQLSLVAPQEAEQLLHAKAIPAAEVTEIVERYSKECRRIRIDMKQEKEKKLLSVRHRLETELSESIEGLSQDYIEDILDAVITKTDVGLISPLRLAGPPIDRHPVTINVGSHVINAVNAVISEEISGDVMFGVQDSEILELIKSHAIGKETELSSALRELGDESAPKADRIQAKQKLKSFLFGLAGKIPDVAISLFSKYLEKRIGGS